MIAASFVEEALDSLRRRGLPAAPLLAAAGLPKTVVEPVSTQSYGATLDEDENYAYAIAL